VPLPAELLDLLQQAQTALDTESDAARAVTATPSAGGVRTKTTATGYRYTFRVEDTTPLVEGPAVVATGAVSAKGSIDRIDGDSVVVTVNRDLGARPGATTISCDTVFLLERLRDLLRAYENGSLSCNAHLLAESMGLESPREEPGVAACVPSDLTPDQAEVVVTVARRSTTPVQGPAGTGKSTTLGATISERARAGESILLVSTTNVAVDAALTHVLKRVRPEQLGLPHSILRLGAAVELAADDEARIGARHLAELRLPEAARPERLRRSRESALAPMEEVDLARVRGLLVEAPASQIESWTVALHVAAIALQTVVAAAASAVADDLASVESTPGAGRWRRGKARPPRKPRRALHDELLESVRVLPREDAESLYGALATFIGALRACDDLLGRLKKLVDRIERDLIGEAHIVGATIAKATVTDVVIERDFDLVVIDEVSMANLAQVMAVVGRARRACLLVGDFRQLAPIAMTHSPEAKQFLERDVFQQMGIVETIDAGRTDPRLLVLNTQFRMHPHIAAAPSKLNYGGRLVTARSVAKRTAVPLPFLRSRRRVGVVNTASLGGWCIKAPGTHSRINPASAATSAAVVAHLHEAGIPLEEIAVVTPYAQHARIVQAVLEDQGLGAVTASTVHRVQSLQREAIVLDLPDCPPAKVSQMLRTSRHVPEDMVRRLLNVAITRARQALVLVANWPHLKAACSPSSPLGRLFAEPGYRAPFTNAAELIASSPLGQAIVVHGPGSSTPIATGREVTLLLGHVDVAGMLRTLRTLGAGTRVRAVYRAEGAIGRSNIDAVVAALQGTRHDVVAVGLESTLADLALTDREAHVYAAPPWHTTKTDGRAVTVGGEEIVAGLERALRIEEVLRLAGGAHGTATCHTCGVPLVARIDGGRVRTRCGHAPVPAGTAPSHVAGSRSPSPEESLASAQQSALSRTEH
jgi:hypothetical protein